MLFVKKKRPKDLIWDTLDANLIVHPKLEGPKGQGINCKDILDAIEYPKNTRTEQNHVVSWMKSKGAIRLYRSRYIVSIVVRDDKIFSHSCLLF